MLGLAVGDDGFELGGGRGEVGGRGLVCGLVGAVVGKLGLLGMEVFEAGVQAGDALLAALGGEAALLEGVEVALGCAFCACDLCGDCVAAFVKRGLFPLSVLAGGGDRVVDEWAVAVDAGELVKDRGLQLVAWDALAGAGFGAVLLAGGAGVVVVGAAFAACGHADVGASAVAAAYHAGEQEVGAVAAAA